ncbi:TetR/AcrR family transcriptional regulator [Kribbella sandramycini]|uniref:AcrR family transcriptional regulator n=1 Tax=Kribbella sandramycini TaxID=60450 RepID=A0A7Y4KUV0_9ACTN|nr:TetR/AcrR family transcriptional regulator [Kribbella sandramycini]MBB6568461.1 AcrR family transcriptional regulator [Kribbella sandramycini]NOL38949.1 TetR/AcrR family transcriptional regulator [Kribbella sandramycini]
MTQSPWQPISPPKPPRPAKAPLTRERIVDAAMRLLVDHGYDAVSMRKVAQELGTGQASLYAHVANKSELDQLLVNRAAEQMEFPAEPDPERWQEQLKDCMREMLRVMRANPGVARAAIGQVPLGEQALLSTEKFLAILKAGNLPDQAAAWAVDLIPLYVTAVSFEETVQSASAWTPADLEGYVGRMRSYFEGLPADRFPLTLALAGALTSGSGGDERFEFGISVITAGLASLAEKP